MLLYPATQRVKCFKPFAGCVWPNKRISLENVYWTVSLTKCKVINKCKFFTLLLFVNCLRIFHKGCQKLFQLANRKHHKKVEKYIIYLSGEKYTKELYRIMSYWFSYVKKTKAARFYLSRLDQVKYEREKSHLLLMRRIVLT